MTPSRCKKQLVYDWSWSTASGRWRIWTPAGTKNPPVVNRQVKKQRANECSKSDFARMSGWALGDLYETSWLKLLVCKLLI